MEENKAPSFEEITEAWRINCREAMCKKCKLNNDRFPCDQLYIYAVLTGEMQLTDSFKKEEPNPEPKLPAWCKVGQWVTDSREQTCLGVIESIQDRFINVDWKQNPHKFKNGIGPLETVKPVHFRPYTFEEAEELLGKAMEWSYMVDMTCASLVYEVEENGAGIEINGVKFCDLQRWNATIDGIPIGVPEVDEEAMKASHTCEAHEGGMANEEN